MPGLYLATKLKFCKITQQKQKNEPKKGMGGN